ncbi:MAG: sugar nucleotide-binding protein, partial [Gemmatimonadaceae bacterium]
RGKTTWHGFATEIARRIGFPGEVVAISSDQANRRAIRPSYSVLDVRETEALVGAIPDWKDAISRALPSDFSGGVPNAIQ